MRRSVCLCLILTALVIGVVSQCNAQFGDENQKWSVFGGVYMPAGSELTDMGSSVWKSFGLGMNVKMDSTGKPKALVSLDYAGVKKDHFSASKVSLGFTHYVRQSVNEATGRGAYLGIGLSASALTEKIEGRPFILPPVDAEDNTGIKIGGHVLAGFDFNESFYAEVKYTIMPELVPDANFGGLSVMFGTRTLF